MATPVKIKVIVAIIDLSENRPIPQMPWPLVQPLLTLVPIPTSRPEKMINGKESVIKNGISLLINILNIIGPVIKPIRNNKLSILLIFNVRKLLAIPLTPANLPFPIKNNTTARPIIAPPAKAVKGVKFTMFIKRRVLFFFVLQRFYLIRSKTNL